MKPSAGKSVFAKTALSFVAVVAVPLVLLGGTGLWFTAQEQRSALQSLQRAQAEAAAERIGQFVLSIQGQLAWTTQASWDEDTQGDAHLIDAHRVLRQAHAITDLALLDGDGRERLAISRLALDRIGSGKERGAERAFVQALSRRVFYGPVSIRRETEPFMTLAVAGARRDTGVAVAEVNLKFIWDVVGGVRIGREGRTWVVDEPGRLVAHSDMSFLLSNPDVAARAQSIIGQLEQAQRSGSASIITGLRGDPVFASFAVSRPTGWKVVVEVPETEAMAPLRQSAWRAFWVALASCSLAVGVALLLARRLVRPIRALTEGAARLRARAFEYRLDVRTGDELETLAHQFNLMAGELQSAYVGLEAKVAERTRALAQADAAKTRFLAAASHDLRQPLHALNLLVAQLRAEPDERRRQHATERIERALADINALFDGLLDISRLDSHTVRCEPRPLPLAPLLEHVREALAADAAAKGIRLRVAPCRAWVRSDPQLLERVLLNLVGNAVRYTARGGVLIGARRRDGAIDLEVLDTGIGIAPEHQQRVFDEHVRLGAASRLGGEGLGLGLAIVRRLVRLLDHELTLHSDSGRGTRFVLRLPIESPRAVPAPALPEPAFGSLNGVRVLVIDDDERVRSSTAGLLRAWGCEVTTAESIVEAMAQLQDQAPGLVIADLYLGGDAFGSDAVAQLRDHFRQPLMPAVLLSGDVGPAARERAREAALVLLDKPVRPMALRSLVMRLLIDAQAVSA